MNTGLYLLEFDNTFGTLSGNVTDANSTLPLEGVTVSVPAASKTTSTNVNGDYSVILDPATYQVDYSLFGYAPQSINVNIFTATTTVQDVALAPLPTGGLSGTVTSSGALAGGGGPLANALVRIQNTPLSTQTNGAGQYGFPTVPEGGYTVEVILPGFQSEQAPVSIVSPGTTTQNFALDSGDFADNFENDFGWIVGAVDDNATTGIWTRVDPNGTQGGTIQPENDHTVVGTQCFVTGQGSPGGSIGEADVDAGKTTLLTPVCNLTGFTTPSVFYWWWYVNDGNATVDDTFRVDATEDGVAWVNLATISTSSPAWSSASHSLAGLFSDYSAIQIRFVAEDTGGGSIVEAAIDDILIADDAVVDVNDVTDVFSTRLLPASPNPFRTDASIRFELAEAGRASIDVFDVQGRLVRRLVNDALAAGSHTIAWDGLNGVGATTPPGVYMLRLTTPDASKTSKIVRSR